MPVNGVSQSDNYLYKTLTERKNQQDTSLSVDSFLSLIAMQLSNQDPMNPMQDTEFMSQLAQFTTLQATQNMATQNAVSYAASLVGKDITAAKILKTGEMITTTGAVTGVSFFEGEPVIYIGNEAYWLDQIMSVGSLPEPPKEEGGANAGGNNAGGNNGNETNPDLNNPGGTNPNGANTQQMRTAIPPTQTPGTQNPESATPGTEMPGSGGVTTVNSPGQAAGEGGTL